MKKEAERQKSSALFEGMTSLRAVLYAMEKSVSDRRIERVLLDKNRTQKGAKSAKKSAEFAFVHKMGKVHGFVMLGLSAEVETFGVSALSAQPVSMTAARAAAINAFNLCVLFIDYLLSADPNLFSCP